MSKSSGKKESVDGCGIFVLCFFAAIVIGILSYMFYRSLYSPEKLNEAIEDCDFERVHKILKKMSTDEEYTKEEFHFFSKNGESEYSKQCTKAFNAEIIYLIREGAVDRIENVATLYPDGSEKLPELLYNQSSNIYRHLDKMNEASLLMLCKYILPAGIVANYVTRNPTPSELVEFMRRIPYNSYAPTTGHIENPEIVLLNQQFIQETNKYNEACDVALEYAISLKDKDFCTTIISLYKRNIVQELKEGHILTADEYNAEYSDSQKNKAYERMRSAFNRK